MSRRSQYITYLCARCHKANGTTFPSLKDHTVTRAMLKNTPIRYVSNNLTMYLGLRRCKHCKTWLIVVFCGWYFEKYAFSYLPYKTEYQGTLGPEVAQWVIRYLLGKEVKIPKELKLWKNTT